MVLMYIRDVTLNRREARNVVADKAAIMVGAGARKYRLSEATRRRNDKNRDDVARRRNQARIQVCVARCVTVWGCGVVVCGRGACAVLGSSSVGVGCGGHVVGMVRGGAWQGRCGAGGVCGGVGQGVCAVWCGVRAYVHAQRQPCRHAAKPRCPVCGEGWRWCRYAYARVVQQRGSGRGEAAARG